MEYPGIWTLSFVDQRLPTHGPRQETTLYTVYTSSHRVTDHCLPLRRMRVQLSLYTIVWAAASGVNSQILWMQQYHNASGSPCSDNVPGISRFIWNLGVCDQVTVSQPIQSGNTSILITLGRVERLENSSYIIEIFSDRYCHGRARILATYPINTCLRLSRPIDQFLLPGAKQAKVSHSNTPVAPLSSLPVTAAVNVYPSLNCLGHSIPYPMTFVPNHCYTNATQILPTELGLLPGATYPPIFTHGPVRISISGNYFHIHEYTDPSCTVYKDRAATLSYQLGHCTNLGGMDVSVQFAVRADSSGNLGSQPGLVWLVTLSLVLCYYST